jgi:hypothetical protein
MIALQNHHIAAFSASYLRLLVEVSRVAADAASCPETRALAERLNQACAATKAI